MDLRIMTEPQQGASYADLLRIARATEELGFDAFFRSDHYLAMGSGDGLPGPSDAVVTLAGLARDTSRIRLGTMVTPITFRLPGPLAISIANIDDMSGGRVELGLGTGWFEAEHTAYGIDFPGTAERFDRLAEQVEILDGLWRTPPGDTFTFAGSYYTLTDAPALPKPVQSPRPPLILGGSGKRRSAGLAARFADEYNVGFKADDEARAILGRVRGAADEAGRSLVYSVAHAACVGRDDAEVSRRADAIGQDLATVRRALGGTPAEVVDRIGQFADWGVTRIYFQVLDLTDLDHLELIASEVLPQV